MPWFEFSDDDQMIMDSHPPGLESQLDKWVDDRNQNGHNSSDLYKVVPVYSGDATAAGYKNFGNKFW